MGAFIKKYLPSLADGKKILFMSGRGERREVMSSKWRLAEGTVETATYISKLTKRVERSVERSVFKEPHFEVFQSGHVNPEHTYAAIPHSSDGIDEEVFRSIGSIFKTRAHGTVFVAGVVARGGKGVPSCSGECAGYAVLVLDPKTMRRAASGVKVVDLAEFDGIKPLFGYTNANMEQEGGRRVTVPRGKFILSRYAKTKGWYATHRGMPTGPVVYEARFVNFGRAEDVRTTGNDPIHEGLTLHAELTAGGVVPLLCVPDYE